MKIETRIIIVVLLLAANYYAESQRHIDKTEHEWRVKIEAINTSLEQRYITKDDISLVGMYAKDFTFFPEYKPAIFETRKLKSFFTEWFKQVNIRAYKKKVSSVEVFSDHILEIGTFSLNYTSVSIQQGTYTGNYMILWKQDDRQKLMIMSETFGAEKYIEPEAVPYANVQVERTDFTAIHKVAKNLIAEVEKFDAVVLKAVATGDGNARANGFTKDAILLPSFDSIRVGMEHIRPKMLKTYTSDASYVVKHTYNRIYDFGDYIFVSGHYSGGWGDSVKGGRFDGNMSNLLKRIESGALLMHRQAGNRDSPLVLFDN